MEMGRSCSPSFPRTVSLPALKNSIQNPVFFLSELRQQTTDISENTQIS